MRKKNPKARVDSRLRKKGGGRRRFWRGRPLVSHQVIINLIANTTTQTGVKIRAQLDRGNDPSGIKISDAELSALNLKLGQFHGDWNYALLPLRKTT